MDVTLPPELEKLVEAKVQSGLFATPSDVVEQALLVLQQRDADLKVLRARIDEGVTSLDQAEGIDDEEFMEKLAGEMEAHEAKVQAE